MRDPRVHGTIEELVSRTGNGASARSPADAAAPADIVVLAVPGLLVEDVTSGGPISVPLVGDDDSAKEAVAELVRGLGLEPVDLGPLQHARHVEGMLILWINAEAVGGKAFEYHLRTGQDY